MYDYISWSIDNKFILLSGQKQEVKVVSVDSQSIICSYEFPESVSNLATFSKGYLMFAIADSFLSFCVPAGSI